MVLDATPRIDVRVAVRRPLRNWLVALVVAALAAILAVPVAFAGSSTASLPVTSAAIPGAVAPAAASTAVPTPIPADWSNVRSFGAKGDGATDDTRAFAAAVSAAQVRGGTVYVPVGTYLVSHVTLPSHVQLLGESRTGSVLRYSGVRAEVLDRRRRVEPDPQGNRGTWSRNR